MSYSDGLYLYVVTHVMRCDFNVLFQDSKLESNLSLDKVSIDEILEAQRVEQENKASEKAKRELLLQKRGLPMSDVSEDIYS